MRDEIFDIKGLEKEFKPSQIVSIKIEFNELEVNQKNLTFKAQNNVKIFVSICYSLFVVLVLIMFLDII